VDAEKKVSEVCASPLCHGVVEPGRDDKRYCGDKCRQAMSLIKRTAALFGLTVERMVELLKGKP
jgi:hypothetical protein